MNKFWKTLLAALCVVALLMTMTGCKKDEAAEEEAQTFEKNPVEELIGSWSLTDVEGTAGTMAETLTYMKAVNGSLVFSFTETEISMVASMGDSILTTDTGAYTLEGNRILSEEAGNMDFAVDGDTLRLTVDGETMVLTRQK